MEFPASIEELKLAEIELEKQKADNEAEKVSSLKARVIELEQQAVAANAKLEVFESQKRDSELTINKLIEIEKANAFLKVEFGTGNYYPTYIIYL